MEKIVNQEKTTTSNELLSLTNRKNLKLEGIIEVLATSDTNLTLKLKDTTLCITGENINILKLDVNTGLLEAEGKFNNFRYGKGGNIFKRIFKWKFHSYYKWKIYLLC